MKDQDLLNLIHDLRVSLSELADDIERKNYNVWAANDIEDDVKELRKALQKKPQSPASL